MPTLKEIREVNKSLSQSSKSFTAVFVGATSGIGLGTIKAVLQCTKSSTIIIVGRSEAKFNPTLKSLQELEPTAKLIFLEAQVSLLKEVDRICTTITCKITSLDILWLSQGGLDSSRHQLNSEGLFPPAAIAYYSRILFVHRMLPLLRKSTSEGGSRVVSVLSAGQEGRIDIGDFGVQRMATFTSLGFWGVMKHHVSMTSLAMHELALQNKTVSFLHTNPGFVSTPVHLKWADTMTGWLAPLSWLMKWVVIPITHSLATTPQQAGEVGFYEATNSCFDAQTEPRQMNFFRVSENGEDVGQQGTKVFEEYDRDGTREKVWEHTLHVFDQVLAS